MLDANDLIMFVRVVDAGSFTQAAERMDLPKSTLSRRLGLLEDTLGEKLFVRSTRRLAITEFGESILDHARRLVDEAEDVSALAQHRQATPRGELRISMAPDFIEFDFAGFCLAFRERYPEIVLRLDLSPRRVDLVAERFDLAIRAAHTLPDDATLVARKLFDMGQGLYASPDYLARQGTPQTPDELAHHTCLPVGASDGQPMPWQLERGSEKRVWAPHGPLLSNSPRLQRELAVRGIGIAYLPADYMVHSLIEQGQLVRVLGDWTMPLVGVWCMLPGRRLLPARTRVFIEMLKEHLDDLPRRCPNARKSA
jgi:DNA-binding transcriptional LysR family regulator